MKLDELVAKNGGERPAEHWECPEVFGGCGNCFETAVEKCTCGGPIFHVVVYKDRRLVFGAG